MKTGCKRANKNNPPSGQFQQSAEDALLSSNITFANRTCLTHTVTDQVAEKHTYILWLISLIFILPLVPTNQDELAKLKADNEKLCCTNASINWQLKTNSRGQLVLALLQIVY
jgi:hypothetical protein